MLKKPRVAPAAMFAADVTPWPHVEGSVGVPETPMPASLPAPSAHPLGEGGAQHIHSCPQQPTLPACSPLSLPWLLILKAAFNIQIMQQLSLPVPSFCWGPGLPLCQPGKSHLPEDMRFS